MKKYGRAVLVQAKDLTKAKMLQNMPCRPKAIFENVKPDRTFNSCITVLYNYAFFNSPEKKKMPCTPSWSK